MIRKTKFISIALLCFIACASFAASAQEASAEDQQKEKAELEKRAVILLDQTVAEAQSLRLPANRLRIQIAAGDLLWERDENRARGFFSSAASGVAEMMRGIDGNERQYFTQIQTASQLREELLLAVARRDASLAYQFLAMTRPPAPPPGMRNPRGANTEANLEQNLLAQIAAVDPKLALQNAEELLNKGQYPTSLARILSQLQTKDKEAAAKFADKLLTRLRSENLAANVSAGSLAMSLLQPGPRAPETPAGAPKQGIGNSSQALSETAYRELLESVVAAALKASPGAAPANRGPGPANGGPGSFRGGRRNDQQQGQGATQTAAGDAQNEQSNARALLSRLQFLLPQIDKYLPARAPAVRQKLTALGFGNEERQAMSRIGDLVRQGTSESLISAAATAPPEMQNALYQQAVQKAIEEGNPDLARKIASEKIPAQDRESVLQTIELTQSGAAAEANELEKIRQTIAGLGSNEEKVDQLIRLSNAAKKKNPKLAIQFLEDAQPLVTGRAGNYQQLDLQLKVVRAMAELDPARAFETIEPGINQLNELISATATLSGFDVPGFQDGEFMMQGGGRLSGMVRRYGQELSLLAKSDFDKSQSMADKFHLAESRIIARMAIARGLLGGEQQSPEFSGRNPFGGRPGFGPNGPPLQRP